LPEIRPPDSEPEIRAGTPTPATIAAQKSRLAQGRGWGKPGPRVNKTVAENAKTLSQNNSR